MNYQQQLEQQEVRASVPCRIDFGGTLDLATFYLPLNQYNPSTVNLALDLRTSVTLSPWRQGRIRISSRGFDSAEFEADAAPFNHPMGLMFACAAFFNAQGVHIQINSASPPRSALGGSSAAAVAIIAAFHRVLGRSIDPGSIAMAAHCLESSVAGVPCGSQDQLAAAFGGVNQWSWRFVQDGSLFVKKALVPMGGEGALDPHLLVAYCGNPHESRDINRRWVDGFLAGRHRKVWKQIARLTEAFAAALVAGDYALAGQLMNQETRLRLEMTPDVLDPTGMKLFERAETNACGARFTGAGGGGCIWALGGKNHIADLKADWLSILAHDPEAGLLKTKIDPIGIIIS
ncbi:putative galactokinase [Desulforapulum autotrophicum HRM2]|uniref:Galactokinase n=1 Tax=Desulforapulum autotrophicum (strain ATCC 43914 / DSM 3382 / VKM B-1955 / HRM2) TaxID=177437 RepID=C0QJ91_DESAH|nr:galactokinase [Desulforapulum autotrophicum]ACN15904.1 putative galactokinase [Desulforapulum autotrophicum HRM2]